MVCISMKMCPHAFNRVSLYLYRMSLRHAACVLILYNIPPHGWYVIQDVSSRFKRVSLSVNRMSLRLSTYVLIVLNMCPHG